MALISNRHFNVGQILTRLLVNYYNKKQSKSRGFSQELSRFLHKLLVRFALRGNFENHSICNLPLIVKSLRYYLGGDQTASRFVMKDTWWDNQLLRVFIFTTEFRIWNVSILQFRKLQKRNKSNFFSIIRCFNQSVLPNENGFEKGRLQNRSLRKWEILKFISLRFCWLVII